jgi:hypothetical protein
MRAAAVNGRTAGRTQMQRALVAWFCVLLGAASTGGSTAAPVEEILSRTSHTVQRFWTTFPEVDCTEQVLQTKLEPNGKVSYQQQSQYDYLILVGPPEEEFSVSESRLLQKQDSKGKNIPLLITNGFSMLLLIFHPYFQGSFEFTRMADEALDGQPLLRLHFRHVKGTRSPSALELRGRTYPLEWEGTAWIAPETWAVLRIEAGLAAPMDDVGLHVLHTDVRYAPVHFSTSKDTYWLPQTAEIEAQTPRQRWRNRHRFTDYKRFSTDAKEDPRTQP